MRDTCLNRNQLRSFYDFTWSAETRPVVRLDVHLENHNTVYFKYNSEEGAVETDRPGTKVSEWIVAKERYLVACHMPYENTA